MMMTMIIVTMERQFIRKKLKFQTLKIKNCRPCSNDNLGGRSKSQFEPFAKNKATNPEKGKVETEIGEIVTANEKVETKNKKRGRPKAKNKNLKTTIQKFSNHIEFIDYIPTHELITYRHLFAYGFYVE